MTVKVSWWDILRGKQMNATHCAVARALKRAGYDNPGVSVGLMEIGGKQIHTPLAVARFVAAFDNAKTYRDRLRLRPFAFQV